MGGRYHDGQGRPAAQGAQAVRDQLQTETESRERAFKNSWQTVIYRAANSNGRFCNRGLAAVRLARQVPALELVMNSVIFAIGPGSISQAIAKRVSAGKHLLLADPLHAFRLKSKEKLEVDG